jgi:hypothetical protein
MRCLNQNIARQANIEDECTGKTDLIEFNQVLKPLLHFEEGIRNEQQNGVLFSYIKYLQLVDWTGRAIRDDKRGHISNGTPTILAQLTISSKQWLINPTQCEAIHWRRFNRIEPTFNTG